MDELKSLYGKLLHFGFMKLQEALGSQDYAWVEVELDFLHNIPSLLDEPNYRRHRYFWFGERTCYIERVVASGRDDLHKKMKMFYEPIWDEMEPIMLKWLSEQAAAETSSSS